MNELPARLTSLQQQVTLYHREGGERLFISGLPGTGKSTALMARLAALLREGRRPYEILVLVPQRAQIDRYERILSNLDAPTRGGVDMLTFYSFSQRAVGLFWPLLARPAGFAHPDREPVFLTFETAQYVMWRIVEPLITREGYFSDVTIRRERLLAQLVDNLNRAAVAGIDHTDIYRRLRGAWTGSPDHVNSYWQAQDCAIRYRQYCLDHNLLDFSLATEVFHRHLMPNEVYRRYFTARYRHLLVDNLEENVPVAHELISWAMEQCQSSVLARDVGGGYRVFLGVDPAGADEVAALCSDTLVFDRLLEPTADALAFSDALRHSLRLDGESAAPQGHAYRAIADQGGGRYWIGMVNWVAQQIARRVSEGTPAGRIAIVAPYVSEVMRFAIQEALERHGIGLYLLRPSTPLRDDPVIRALLALVLLGHPEWEILIQGEEYVLPVEDVAHALHLAIADLDPIRARHLAGAALPPGRRALNDLGGASTDGASARDIGRLWESVGYQARQRYETLRVWLETYRRGEPESVDVFLSRLFADLLSRPGFGLYNDPDRARPYGRLVESAYKFRQAIEKDGDLGVGDVACDYVQLILGGIGSAEYLLDWPRPDREEDGVVLAPVHAYLTRDVRSDYQFWIDVGSDGWWNRPNQPLTHPYVLSPRWPVGRPWRDIEEEQSRREALGRMVQGLAARCMGRIYLAYSELGIDGVEQSGRLQRAIMMALSRVRRHE
jgi:hypothetical protein